MRTRVAAAALAAGILAAACSTSSPGPSPTSTGPSPATAPTGSATLSPAVKSLRAGKATLKVTGAEKANLSLPLSPPGASTWTQATGEISLKYLTREGNALLIDGTLPGHSAATSTTL